MHLLEAKDVLCANGVGPPEGLIEVFPIPPAELRGEVIYEIGFDALDDLFYLAVFTDIASNIVSRRVMAQVTCPNFVTVLLESINQGTTNRSASPGYQNSHRHDAWKTDL